MPRKRGIIETDRLILRPLYDTDAKDLYTIGLTNRQPIGPECTDTMTFGMHC